MVRSEWQQMQGMAFDLRRLDTNNETVRASDINFATAVGCARRPSTPALSGAAGS